jgi:DNA end-binding protein Ku
MPRAMWSGTISFGLVSIPVKLYPAVRRKSVSFNQLDRKTMSRVKQKRVSATDGREVPYEDIVKGFEVSRDQYVVVDDDELASLAPEATHTIDISDFTDLADIDPVFYDAAYHLAPDTAGRKPYALLARAMEQSGRVAIATFVLRTKQYLCAVRPVDGRLVLSTMVYADELADPAEVPGLDEVRDVEVNERELTMATQLIESLYTSFEPERYRDDYREALLSLIEAKAAGEEITVEPEAPREEKVVDLMAALEASVAAAKEARKRHPTARPAAAEAEADETPAETPTEAAPRRRRRSA